MNWPARLMMTTVALGWLGVAGPAHAQATAESVAAQGLFDEAKALMAAGKASADAERAVRRAASARREPPAAGCLECSSVVCRAQ